jgi:MHS family proline/betaine transporter-like MFS transporter
VVAVVGYLIRRRLEDPEEYREARAEYREAVGSQESVAASLARPFRAVKSMVFVILLQPPYAVGAYLLTGYMYTYVTEQGGLSPTEGLISNAIAVAALASLYPFMGVISDRVGRRPMYAAGATWLFVTAYPALKLAGSGSFGGAISGQLLLAIGVAIYGGAFFVGVIELFPTALRARGHGISYNASVALFGGATPLIATALIGATGNPVAPAFYGMALIGCIAVFGILLVPETSRLNLRTSFYASRGPANGPVTEPATSTTWAMSTDLP